MTWAGVRSDVPRGVARRLRQGQQPGVLNPSASPAHGEASNYTPTPWQVDLEGGHQKARPWPSEAINQQQRLLCLGLGDGGNPKQRSEQAQGEPSSQRRSPSAPGRWPPQRRTSTPRRPSSGRRGTAPGSGPTAAPLGSRSRSLRERDPSGLHRRGEVKFRVRVWVRVQVMGCQCLYRTAWRGAAQLGVGGIDHPPTHHQQRFQESHSASGIYHHSESSKCCYGNISRGSGREKKTAVWEVPSGGVRL